MSLLRYACSFNLEERWAKDLDLDFDFDFFLSELGEREYSPLECGKALLLLVKF